MSALKKHISLCAILLANRLKSHQRHFNVLQTALLTQLDVLLNQCHPAPRLLTLIKTRRKMIRPHEFEFYDCFNPHDQILQLQLLGHNLSFPSVTYHLLLFQRETEIGWDNKKIDHNELQICSILLLLLMQLKVSVEQQLFHRSAHCSIRVEATATLQPSLVYKSLYSVWLELKQKTPPPPPARCRSSNKAVYESG